MLHFDSRLSNMGIQYTDSATISIYRYRLGFLKSTCRFSKIYAWILNIHMWIICEISPENPQLTVKAKYRFRLIFGITKNLTWFGHLYSAFSEKISAVWKVPMPISHHKTSRHLYTRHMNGNRKLTLFTCSRIKSVLKRSAGIVVQKAVARERHCHHRRCIRHFSVSH